MFKRKSKSLNIFALINIVLAVSVFALFGFVSFLSIQFSNDTEVPSVNGYQFIGDFLSDNPTSEVSEIVGESDLQSFYLSALFFLNSLLMCGLYLCTFVLKIFDRLIRVSRYVFIPALLSAISILTGYLILNSAIMSVSGFISLALIPVLVLCVVAVISFVNDGVLFVRKKF